MFIFFSLTLVAFKLLSCKLLERESAKLLKVDVMFGNVPPVQNLQWDCSVLCHLHLKCSEVLAVSSITIWPMHCAKTLSLGKVWKWPLENSLLYERERPFPVCHQRTLTSTLLKAQRGFNDRILIHLSSGIKRETGLSFLLPYLSCSCHNMDIFWILTPTLSEHNWLAQTH